MIAPAERAQRRRQAVALVWIAIAVLIFAAYRAGWHSVFLARWWNLW